MSMVRRWRCDLRLHLVSGIIVVKSALSISISAVFNHSVVVSSYYRHVLFCSIIYYYVYMFNACTPRVIFIDNVPYKFMRYWYNTSSVNRYLSVIIPMYEKIQYIDVRIISRSHREKNVRTATKNTGSHWLLS